MAFTSSDVKIIKREILFKGRFIYACYRLQFKLYDGSWSKEISREVLERVPAVAILPYDPVLDRVVLIEQFRPGTLNNKPGPWVTEIIAGIIEDDSSPADVAIREAYEEAGCKVSDLQLIQHFFVSPGGSTEEVSIFCGRVDASNVEGIHGLEDEHENIRAFTLSVDEALNKLHNHEIKTAPAVVALQWLEINHAKLRVLWQK